MSFENSCVIVAVPLSSERTNSLLPDEALSIYLDFVLEMAIRHKRSPKCPSEVGEAIFHHCEHAAEVIFRYCEHRADIAIDQDLGLNRHLYLDLKPLN